jgi:hypothetical protein
MGWFSKAENAETSAKDSEASKSGVWGSQLDSALAEARSSRVENAKRGEASGKTPKGAGSGSRVSGGLAEAAKKMFEPEAWKAIVRMPFSLGKVITGRKCWDLEKTQEDTLATSTSATAEYFLQVDPKFVVLTLFLMNWSAVLTEKFMANAVERNKELALNPLPENTEPNKTPNGNRPFTIIKPEGVHI